MQEYSIQRSGRRCHQTDRPFGPGESFYSAVLVRGGELRRVDMSAEVWKGPPAGAIGWWQSRVPEDKKSSLKPAPSHVLLSALESLLIEGTQPVLATMLALLMVRRRILSEQVAPLSQYADPTDAELADESPKTIHLVHASSKREFHVPMCEPPLDECSTYQDQLTRLLFVEE